MDGGGGGGGGGVGKEKFLNTKTTTTIKNKEMPINLIKRLEKLNYNGGHA